ncbi:hypothetical protein WAI453_003135 [Rhynchosporium graminicola]
MSKPAPTQLSFFQAIFANMKEAPDVDWDAVAAQAGYNSGGTARTRFGQIRRELLKGGGTMAVKAPGKPRVKKTPAETAVARSGMNTTASKVTKSKPVRGGKKAAAGSGTASAKLEKDEEMEGDEENEEDDDVDDEMEA